MLVLIFLAVLVKPACGLRARIHNLEKPADTRSVRALDVHSDFAKTPAAEDSAMQLSEHIELSAGDSFASESAVIMAQEAWIGNHVRLTSAVGLAASYAYKAALRAGLDDRFPRNNTDMLTIAFIVLFVLSSFLWVVWSRNSRLATKRQEIKKMNEKLQETIGLFINEMESNLKEITDSTTHMAETIFQARRRDFLKFLMTVRDLPERFADEKCLLPFLRFVKHWLVVFQEYSIDPVNHPLIVVSASELSACVNACAVAGLVAERLEKHKHLVVAGPLSDMKLMIEKHSTGASKNMKALMSDAYEKLESLKKPDGKDSQRRMSLKAMCPVFVGCVVPSQSVTIFGAIGLTIAAFYLHEGDLFIAAVTCLASVCSVFFFTCCDDSDTVRKLESRVLRLQQEHDAVKAHHTLVKNFFSNSQMLASLWLYRTVPSLDVLHEVHERLWDRSNDVAEYLELADVEIERVVQSMGPLSLWYGEDALGHDKLKVIATQFADDILKRVRSDFKEEPDMYARIYKWVDKDSVAACSGCNVRFRRFFASKVHCCYCGDVFCDACTSKSIPIPSRGFEEPVRVCSQCAEAVERATLEAARQRSLKRRLPSMLLRVNTLGFLTVNIRQAFNLTDKRKRTYLMGNSKYFKDIFVRLRIGDGNWVQTSCISDVANPKWNKEFFFPVREQDSVLMVEVCSASRCHGVFDLSFREFCNGEWQHEKRQLDQSTAGELRFEVLFAGSAAELMERPMP